MVDWGNLGLTLGMLEEYTTELKRRQRRGRRRAIGRVISRFVGRRGQEDGPPGGFDLVLTNGAPSKNYPSAEVWICDREHVERIPSYAPTVEGGLLEILFQIHAGLTLETLDLCAKPIIVFGELMQELAELAAPMSRRGLKPAVGLDRGPGFSVVVGYAGLFTTDAPQAEITLHDVKEVFASPPFPNSARFESLGETLPAALKKVVTKAHEHYRANRGNGSPPL